MVGYFVTKKEKKKEKKKTKLSYHVKNVVTRVLKKHYSKCSISCLLA